MRTQLQTEGPLKASLEKILLTFNQVPLRQTNWTHDTVKGTGQIAHITDAVKKITWSQAAVETNP